MKVSVFIFGLSVLFSCKNEVSLNDEFYRQYLSEMNNVKYTLAIPKEFDRIKTLIDYKRNAFEYFYDRSGNDRLYNTTGELLLKDTLSDNMLSIHIGVYGVNTAGAHIALTNYQSELDESSNAKKDTMKILSKDRELYWKISLDKKGFYYYSVHVIIDEPLYVIDYRFNVVVSKSSLVHYMVLSRNILQNIQAE